VILSSFRLKIPAFSTEHCEKWHCSKFRAPFSPVQNDDILLCAQNRYSELFCILNYCTVNRNHYDSVFCFLLTIKKAVASQQQFIILDSGYTYGAL